MAFATCDNAEQLVNRLEAAEIDLAASKVSHLAINPAPDEAVAYISIRDFIAALPRN